MPNGVSGYGDNILWGYNWIMSQPDIGYAKWKSINWKWKNYKFKSNV